MSEKKGILFDLDGTLWDATKQITVSWQRIVDDYNIDTTLNVEDVKACMGLPMDEIFRTLLPDVDEKLLPEIQDKCQKYENEYLSSNAGVLYPELEKTLKELKNMGYHLYIVTNSQDGYIEAFFASTALNDYFDDYEMFGRTNMLKHKNIELVINRNNITSAIYVGDTVGDCNASKKANVPFVFAEYGLGEVTNAEYVIKAFSNLPQLAKQLLN